jgi:hypothetical protein
MILQAGGLGRTSPTSSPSKEPSYDRAAAAIVLPEEPKVFVNSPQNGVDLWAGQPDCQAAHSQLLAALKKSKVTFLPSGTALTTRRKGNLGEFIALTIGCATQFASWRVIAANAHNPLSDNSRTDLDLLWLFFGPSPDQDIGIVQEVKTTADRKLGYADSLIEDYAKLFSTDPQFTLQSRFAVAGNKMEGMGVAPDLCCRARELGGISPATIT